MAEAPPYSGTCVTRDPASVPKLPTPRTGSYTTTTRTSRNVLAVPETSRDKQCGVARMRWECLHKTLVARMPLPRIEVLKESTPIMPTGSPNQRVAEATAETSEATDGIIATRIDRESWAATVRSLIAVHSRGKLQRF